MLLVVELRVGHDRGATRLDCRLDIDPDATVAELRRALADHAATRQVPVPERSVLWADDGRRLDDDHLVTAARLRSGSRIHLAPEAPSRRRPPVAVEIAVVGGPDLGPPTVLGPGTHRLGGSSHDDIALLGAELPPAAVTVEVSETGAVTLTGADGGAPARFAPDELDDGVAFAVGPCALRLRRLPVDGDTFDASGGVRFNRTPHRPVPARPRAVEPVPAPPSPPAPSRVAITSFVLPLASGVGFAVVFGRPQFLLIALLAPVVLLAVHQFEKRRGRRGFRGERSDYLALVGRRADEVARAVDEERVMRHRALPPLDRLVEEARTRRPSLWARGRDAPDLLVTRLGTAAGEPRIEVGIEPGGDDGLRREASERLRAATSAMGDVPVPLDLEQAVTVGLHGDGPLVDGLARSVLGQIVARHGPEDVVVAALVAPAALRSFEWLRWLPHVRSSASPLPGDHLAVWPEAVADVLGALLDLVATAGERTGAFPRIVVVVHEEAAVDRAALGRLLDGAGPAGIRVLWVGRDEALLPRQCAAVVRVAEGEGRSLLASTDPDVAPVPFTAEGAEPGLLDRLARHLAPLRDASSVARAGSIPRQVGLTEVLGGPPVPADVATAWSVSDGGFLDAPVGVGADGLFRLDLVEHGPHALVAGTSGAGKSELLQSWVAALAARHPPERLTFLFIDYKGGAAAAPFAELPHNVGVVTNLDTRMSLRALTSLRAELERRMALLAERGARDLAELAALDPAGCPPRLVIVVDEFATLVSEIPDFVTGVVDVAQRGRSLGIHLILATQRPAGAVNENILANTNLRIALRVVDRADSQNVIGSGEAADIPVPLRGRAFARVGPTELVPFQAAWSGAPRLRRESGRVRVAPFGFGPSEHAGDAGGDGGGAPGGTQLEAVLSAVSLAFQRSGRHEPRRPWLPPLPDVVPLESIEHRPDDPGRVAVLGLRDDPARQRRLAATVDLETEGGLAVFGTGGSGRTTALRTAAASLVARASSDDVQLVVFDFAGRALLPLLDVPHARSVLTGDDLDAVARQIDWLAEEVAARRGLLGEARVESLGALREHRREPVVPRIIVVIDGFGALRAELDTPAGHEWLQRLQRLLVDGRQLGIHPLVSADRRADLPNPLLGALGARLVLRMAEPDAMVALGVPLPLARSGGLAPGRGYLRGEEEIQVAVLGDDPSGAAQAEAVVALGASSSTEPAPRPTALPESVSRPAGHDHDLVVAVGVTDDGEPALVDLAGGHFLVVGPPGSGRTTALAAVRAGLDPQGRADVEREVVVVDDADDLDDDEARRLEALAGEEGVTIVAAFDVASVARAFTGLVPALKRGRRLLLLRPESAAEIDQITGVRMRLRPGATFPPGRGVLVVERHPTVVQIGIPDRET